MLSDRARLSLLPATGEPHPAPFDQYHSLTGLPSRRAGSRQLYNEDFDVLVIDEAAQALEAVCWIPVLKATKKLILAGDHLQLPPTIKGSNTDLPDSLKKDKQGSPRTLEVTLFDRMLDLHGSKVKRLLNVQYRMHEKVRLRPFQLVAQSIRN